MSKSKQKNKDILKKSYKSLKPFSGSYKVDFKRFCISLNLITSEKEINNSRVLDLGSGIGLMLLSLKNMGATEVIGLDRFIFPDEKENFFTINKFPGLESIWQKNNIKIKNGDVSNQKLPFKNESLDVVICEALIEHLADSPKELFKEVNRVLKKNGVFLVSTPNLATLLKRIRFLFGRSPHWDLGDFFKSGINFTGHRREFTLDEVKEMLEQSNFNIIKAKTINAFFNFRRFLNPKKILNQIFTLCSFLLPRSRDMVYVLSRKK